MIFFNQLSKTILSPEVTSNLKFELDPQIEYRPLRQSALTSLSTHLLVPHSSDPLTLTKITCLSCQPWLLVDPICHKTLKFVVADPQSLLVQGF